MYVDQPRKTSRSEAVAICYEIVYNAISVVMSAQQVGHADGLPREVVSDYEHNEAFLKAAHHVLMEVRA